MPNTPRQVFRERVQRMAEDCWSGAKNAEKEVKRTLSEFDALFDNTPRTDAENLAEAVGHIKALLNVREPDFDTEPYEAARAWLDENGFLL